MLGEITVRTCTVWCVQYQNMEIFWNTPID